MNISELFNDMEVNKDLEIKGIAINSNEVKAGYLFIALKGTRTDGHQFIEDAINRGASVIVCEQDCPAKSGVIFIKVSSTVDAVAQLSKKFYGDPSSKMKVIGITGTNGKTTTAFLIRNIFQASGIKTGLLGTIDYVVGNRKIPAPLTTPDILKVNQYLSQMLADGCEACIMEVSSHALEQGRVSGINFYTGVYTNVGRDHLDYHKTIDGYINAKTKLFRKLSRDSWAVVNIDDPYSNAILENTLANVVGYGINNISGIDMNYKIKARGIYLSSSGTKFSVYSAGFNKGFLIETKLIGWHNVYNILAAVGVSLSCGIKESAIKEGIYNTKGVPGRLEKIDVGQPFTLFIDYAHTPDAMENVPSTLRKIAKARILILFGCGGNRDIEKRPLMGRIAARMADFSVITTDNPRQEDPLKIISDIERGFIEGNYKIIPDRRDAIKTILNIAQPDDIVLIAGKGHENYQILKNTVVPFSDRTVVEELLSQYAGVTC